MSVTSNQIILYGAASMATANGGTTGGAVSFSTRISFSDFAAAGTVSYVSSSASDTAVTVTITGRNPGGSITTEAKTLTGTTAVAGAVSFQRALQGVVTGTAAVGNVAALFGTAVVTGTAQAAANASGTTAPTLTLQSGQGASCAVNQIVLITNNLPAGVQYELNMITALNGDVATMYQNWTTLPTSTTTYSVYNGMFFENAPSQVTTIIRPYYNIQANATGGATLNVYSKAFVVNTSTTTDYQPQSGTSGVTVELLAGTVALPSGATLNMGLTTALDDTGSTANTTAPAGVTFTTTGLPATQNMSANTGILPHGAVPNAAGAQAVYFELTLPGGTAAYDGAFTTQVNGAST